MKINFSLLNTGLGNNGGSQTIVRSANTLTNLGHEVHIIDSGKNQYTWDKLLCDHVVVKDEYLVPSADVIIATGFKSVQPTMNLPDRCGLKCIWIRGWELWQMKEEEIVDKILKTHTIKFVNGIGLYEKLKNYNVDSFIIRPGTDFDDFQPLNQRRNRKYVVLGGLFHFKHKTKRTDWILDTAQGLKKRFGDGSIKLWMFGTNEDPFLSVINKYIPQPTMKEKNDFYNGVDIWLSPSMLEGLHIVPQEAMLTECCVLTTDCQLNGTRDYIQDQVTGFVSKDNIFSFVRSTENLVKTPMLRDHLGKRGREQILKMGNREDNMKRLISILGELLSGTIKYNYN
jgi:glycosyltransferase involved in cell wall biosynthesis